MTLAGKRQVQENGTMTMWRTLQSFFHDSSGATAIEYALLASLISIGVITTVTAVGAKLNGSYSNIANAFG